MRPASLEDATFLFPSPHQPPRPERLLFPLDIFRKSDMVIPFPLLTKNHRSRIQPSGCATEKGKYNEDLHVDSIPGGGFPESAIETLASCGYHHAEFSDEHGKMLMDRPDPLKAAAELADFANDHGLVLEQAHLHLTADISHPDPSLRQSFLDFLKKELRVYERLGVRAAVLHCGGKAARDQGMPVADIDAITAASLTELCASIEGGSIRIALENIPLTQPFASDLRRMIAKVNRPELESVSTPVT